MSEFAQLRDAILNRLGRPLEELGFAYSKSAQQFSRRAEENVSHFYQLLITKSAPFAIARVHIGTRIPAIETIFHRTSGYERKYQAGTPTMGGALDAITGMHELNMLLDSEQGPDVAYNRLFTPQMISFYEHWYSRFSRISEIDHELNDDPYRETPNRPMPWLRCSTGIIAARLVGRPNFSELATSYSTIMQEFSNGFYWLRFKLLLDDLEANFKPPS